MDEFTAYLTWSMIVFGLNTLGAILVAIRAGKKGRSAAGFFWLGFLLSSIISFIVVLIISPTDEAKMRVTTGSGHTVGPVSCPFCKEMIRPDAHVCKHCGKDVEAALGHIIAERQAKAAFDAEIQRELAEQRAAIWEERKVRFMAWSRRPRVRLGLILGALAVAVLIAMPSIVKGAADANQMQMQVALAEKYGAWSTIASECGLAPSGISNLSVPTSNQSIDFDVDVFVKKLRGASENLTEEESVFVECIASGLGEFQIEQGTPVFVAGVQQVKTNGHVSLTRKFGEIVSETISQGSFGGSALVRTNGFIVQIDGPAHAEGTEMTGTWHVRVSKSSGYGLPASNNG